MRDLVRVDSLRAVLGTQLIAARSVSNPILAGAAGTAGRLSSCVRALDLEKSRVEDALRVVEQVAELKACVAGVVGSMGAPQDWEAAAGYIARARRILGDIVRSGFANAVVPTIEAPDMPSTTLETARENLCALFLREFEKAGQHGHDGKVTCFFKLFPLIGRGCWAGCLWAVRLPRRKCCEGGPQGGEKGWLLSRERAYSTVWAYYADYRQSWRVGGKTLWYGQDGTGDREVATRSGYSGGIIIDLWSDEKQVDRKLTEVRSYPFSFLVRSFLPPQKASTGNSSINSEDEGINIKDVDTLLSEVAAILR
jgi:hypothetical protein